MLLTCVSHGVLTQVEIDFSPPWPRISMMEGLEKEMKTELPALDDPEIDAKLTTILEKFELECTPPHTTARLLDTLVGEFLEDNIVNPTFITEQPEIMSPLAKSHRSKKFLTERFELFVAGREVRENQFIFCVCGCAAKLMFFLPSLCSFSTSACQCLYRVERPRRTVPTFPGTSPGWQSRRRRGHGYG